jgi:hypothetical protein
MNYLTEKKLAHGTVGGILATAVTAIFAAGIASGIVTPHLAPLDPVAVTLGHLGHLYAPAAARIGA